MVIDMELPNKYSLIYGLHYSQHVSFSVKSYFSMVNLMFLTSVILINLALRRQ